MPTTTEQDQYISAVIHPRLSGNPHGTTYLQVVGLNLVATLLDCVARVKVLKGGTLIGTRRGINFIEGDGVTLTVADDAANERTNVTIDMDAPDLSGTVGLGQLQGYIEGLELVWTSDTEITVTSGAAYVEGLGKIVDLDADSVETPSLAASRFYSVYLGQSGGSPIITIATTAPAAPYRGTARSSSGSANLRYLGSFLTDASSHIVPFQRLHNRVLYLSKGFEVLNNGGADTETVIDLSGYVPGTAKAVIVKLRNTTTNTVVLTIGHDGDGVNAPSEEGLFICQPGEAEIVETPCVDQEITYWYLDSVPAAGGAYIDVKGYIEER